MQTADPAYRDTVLPPGIRARVSTGWEKIIGDADRSVGAGHTGASAYYQALYRQFGITAAAVAAAARDSIYDAQNSARPGPPRHLAPAAGGTADRPALSGRPDHDQ